MTDEEIHALLLKSYHDALEQYGKDVKCSITTRAHNGETTFIVMDEEKQVYSKRVIIEAVPGDDHLVDRVMVAMNNIKKELFS